MVITIARTFGSGGKHAAESLSRRLGIPWYDKDIMTLASEASGIDRRYFVKNNEKLSTRTFIKLLTGRKHEAYSITPIEGDFVSNEELFDYQSQLIRYLGLSRSCIILGKCADNILGDLKEVYRFFIDAPLCDLTGEISSQLGLVPEDAEDMVRKTNKYRSDYYKYYTGREWKDPANYDLMINSTRAGRENIDEIIIAYIEIMQGNLMTE